MRRIRRRHVMAAVLVIALGAAGCGGDDEGGNGEGATPGATGEETGGAGGDGATITISGFQFQPSTLEVSGETTVTITNEDGAPHTFTLDDGSVDERIEPGATVEVTVNPSETTGFQCTIHPQMTGTVEVA